LALGNALHSEYSYSEERFNYFSHGFGAGAAAFAGAWLVAQSFSQASVIQALSAVIFVSTLILMLLASTLYHQSTNAKHRARLKVLDHCAIFLLIAGTYTPFSLVALKNHHGTALLVTVWSLAACGIVFKLFYTGRFKLLSTGIYVLMGWLVLADIGPLLREISPGCARWLLAGGAAYTLGAGVYVLKRVRYSHPIWHIFVLLGGGCHFLAVTQQVL
jgi:hemolysin III